MVSSGQRTLEYLAKLDYIKGLDYEKVEQPYNQFTKRRNDMFGIIDVLLLDEGNIGIQACGSDWKPHIEKITTEKREQTLNWLKYNRLILIGWRKLKLNRGGKAIRWTPRIAEFILKDNNICLINKENFKKSDFLLDDVLGIY